MDKTIVLVKLAEEGAIGEEKPISLRELARKLDTSPQTIFRVLERLENEGMIIRKVRGRRTYIELTEKAVSFLEELYDTLGKALYGGFLVGEVISGLGEGAYYVQIYRERIREYLGFDPYPGTLNVRLLFPRTVFDALYKVKPVLIPGFVKNGRTFGDVKAYRIRIDGLESAIVIPSRTVHPANVAEIIAPVKIREKLGLKDGDRVKITIV
ncbi:DUF120 domain-containing protein [Thermococcus gorgonarius]|uniref:Riboflavin kinase n=1 Tax=Thermococcus gorgonarius TaxID=71997 RepID=A0A2Z2MFM9_THEGO|nr:DUF120 domain-containing protein [Thermococcus gorgonarius]ASJ00788.1 riboflavin kinase [Thermococcus gorgonarius]